MDCICPRCASMCHNPCIPTPEEAKKLIEAGFGDRLARRDYGFAPEIPLLLPARYEYEGKHEQGYVPTVCNFFKDGLCELHDLGLKPWEARMIDHTNVNTEADNIHRKVIQSWDNNKAQELCRSWCESHGIPFP